MGDALVTIVVTPREQFSKARAALDSLYAHTSEPFELIYIDGRSPEPLAGYLREMAAKHPNFTLLRDERLLPANVARNLAVPLIKTRYAVFIDNDVEATPGWLGPLVACAEETGCAVVGPVYCVGELDDLEIHTIGAEHGVREVDGHRRWLEKHLFCHQKLNEVRGQLRRRPVGLVEFHCLMLRTEILKQLGPFDPDLLSYFDHNDFCLRVAEAGGAIYNEPASVVRYNPPPPFTRTDLPYFLLRWSNRWIDESVLHFARKNGLSPKDPVFAEHYEYQQAQRARVVPNPRRVVRRLFGVRGLNAWEGVLDRLLGWTVVPRG